MLRAPTHGRNNLALYCFVAKVCSNSDFQSKLYKATQEITLVKQICKASTTLKASHVIAIAAAGVNAFLK